MGCIDPENSIAKGPVVYCLDELSKRADAQPRLEALNQALRNQRESGYRDVAAIFGEYLFKPLLPAAQSEKICAYLNDYWFDHLKPTAEFAELQPIAPTYVEGVIKAVELSLGAMRDGRPRPIDAWWIVDHPGLEVINLINEHCVTLLIMTPRPTAIGVQGIWNPAAEAWSTIQESTGEAITRRIENRPDQSRQSPPMFTGRKEETSA